VARVGAGEKRLFAADIIYPSVWFFQDLNLFSIDFGPDESGGGGEKHIFAADSKRALLQWTEVSK
jgi:hypothetical protein